MSSDHPRPDPVRRFVFTWLGLGVGGPVIAFWALLAWLVL